MVDTVDISASDSITIKSEEELEIPVTLSHEGTAVSFTKDQLTWEDEGNIGEFVSPGKFKAATYKNEGKIKISYGDTIKEIAVTIDGPEEFTGEIIEVKDVFEDLETHLWAKDAVNRLCAVGVVRGVSEVEFAPAREIKRADFMLMLLRLMEIEIDTEVTDSFEDVPENSYYYYELATAKRLGITQGTSPTTFHPERQITREEMFTLTWRTLALDEAADITNLDGFTDCALIAEYAKPALSTLVSLGLVAGDNNGNVNPKGNATRAESAVFLDRVFAHIKGDSVKWIYESELSETN